MKKKIALILVLCIVAVTLCGCSGDGYGQYPYIHVLNTMWRADNINIPVGEAYIIDVRKPYEITFNDDGAIVSIYFLRKGEY